MILKISLIKIIFKKKEYNKIRNKFNKLKLMNIFFIHHFKIRNNGKLFIDLLLANYNHLKTMPIVINYYLIKRNNN